MESMIFKQKDIFLDIFCCIFLNVIKNSKCDTLKNSSDVKVDYLDTSNTLYSESKLGLDCSEDDIECMDYMPEYGLYTEDDYDFEYAAVTSQKKLFSTTTTTTATAVTAVTTETTAATAATATTATIAATATTSTTITTGTTTIMTTQISSTRPTITSILSITSTTSSTNKNVCMNKGRLKKTIELSFSIWFHHSVHNIF